jgi:hypothetical protein
LLKEGKAMTVKFNQYWRIDPEKSPEYEKYVLSKFILSLP